MSTTATRAQDGCTRRLCDQVFRVVLRLRRGRRSGGVFSGQGEIREGLGGDLDGV